MCRLGAAGGGAHLAEAALAPPLPGGAVPSTNQRALGAGRGRSWSGPQFERRERSETLRGAEGSKRALRSPSPPLPWPRRLLLLAAGPELCDPEVPVPLLCGVNSNGGGCSSRNNSHTIRSRSGSGGGGSGLPHPYPHSHLPVPGGGGRGRRQRRRLDQTGHLQVRRCAARRGRGEGAAAVEPGTGGRPGAGGRGKGAGVSPPPLSPSPRPQRPPRLRCVNPRRPPRPGRARPRCGAAAPPATRPAPVRAARRGRGRVTPPSSLSPIPTPCLRSAGSGRGGWSRLEPASPQPCRAGVHRGGCRRGGFTAGSCRGVIRL